MNDYIRGLLDRLIQVDLQLDYYEGMSDQESYLWYMADLHDERHFLHADIREYVSYV